MRVLIVKTSSLGSVLNTLPAITDACLAKPNVQFDWVVEEDFTEIPKWHPAVEQVIPVAIRRWRKRPFKFWGSQEVRHFKNMVRKHHYDLVIDAQGLLKSAWVARQVKAPIAGFDRDSAREPWAAMAYQHRIYVSPSQDPVTRLRELFSKALDYRLPKSFPDYGINHRLLAGSPLDSAYLVMMQDSVKQRDTMSVEDWRVLVSKVVAAGYRVKLPWVTPEGKQRAKDIAAGFDQVELLPKVNLRGLASVLLQSRGSLVLDNGYSALGDALSVPTLLLRAGAGKDQSVDISKGVDAICERVLSEFHR